MRPTETSPARMLAIICILAIAAAPLAFYIYVEPDDEFLLQAYTVIGLMAPFLLSFFRFPLPAASVATMVKRMLGYGLIMFLGSVIALMIILHMPRVLAMDFDLGASITLLSGVALLLPVIVYRGRGRERSERRIPPAVGMTLGTLAAFGLFLALGYAAVYLYNQSDQELTPLAASFNEYPSCELPAEDNAYFTWLGLATQSGNPANQAGQDLYAQFMELPLATRSSWFDVATLEGVQDLHNDLPYSWSEALDQGLLPWIAEHRQEIEDRLEANQEYYSTFEQIFHSPDLCFPPYADNLQRFRVDQFRPYLLQVLLMVQDGNLSAALERMAVLRSFGTMLVNADGTLVTTIVGIVILSNTTDILMTIIDTFPEIIQDPDMLASLEHMLSTPDLQFPTARDLLLDTARDAVHSALFLQEQTGDQASVDLRSLLLRDLYHPRESANIVAEHMDCSIHRIQELLDGTQEAGMESCDQILRDQTAPGLSLLSNPMGRVLFNMATPNFSSLIPQIKEHLENKPMLARLRLDMLLQNVTRDEVREWLAARPERDANTGSQPVYDPESQTLGTPDSIMNAPLTTFPEPDTAQE